MGAALHGPKGAPAGGERRASVAERGADGVSSLGRRPARVATSGVVGKASGALRRRRSARPLAEATRAWRANLGAISSITNLKS